MLADAHFTYNFKAVALNTSLKCIVANANYSYHLYTGDTTAKQMANSIYYSSSVTKNK